MVLVLVGTWWYWVNINWYCLVLSGTMAFMPVYIEKSGDLVGCHHSGTDKQTKKERQSYSANGPWKAEMSKQVQKEMSDKVIWRGWQSLVTHKFQSHSCFKSCKKNLFKDSLILWQNVVTSWLSVFLRSKDHLKKQAIYLERQV